MPWTFELFCLLCSRQKREVQVPKCQFLWSISVWSTRWLNGFLLIMNLLRQRPGDWPGFGSWIVIERASSYELRCLKISLGPVGQIPGWWGQRGGLAGTIWQVINKKLISYDKQHTKGLVMKGFYWLLILHSYVWQRNTPRQSSWRVALCQRGSHFFSGKISWLKSKS